MGERGQKRSWRPARVSSMPSVKAAARRFCPPYVVAEEAPWALRVKLTDPSGRRPDISVGHRHQRRLFLKANYLSLSSTVTGHGPERDAELSFHFRGPSARGGPGDRGGAVASDAMVGPRGRVARSTGDAVGLDDERVHDSPAGRRPLRSA